MWKQTLAFGLTAAVLTDLPSLLLGEEQCNCSSLETKRWTFDSKEALAGWTVTGDVGFDSSRSREGQRGALRIGPGGKAIIKLRDKAESGKLELWVYDDGTTPEKAKAARVGPRWGLLENDAKVLAAGILYNSYLGGDEGYTATLYDGKTWFNQLFWLGVPRTPPAWHKWTFDFDAEAGLQVFHNGKELGAVDPAKVDLKGFTSIAIWGDESGGRAQNIWVSNASVTLGGPVKIAATGGESDPYDDKAVAADAAASWPVTFYTKDNPPRTPKLDELPLAPSVSEYGITWTFKQPARTGRFVNGDWYVLGPVTVKAIDPKPLYGSQIPRFQLDAMDKERPETARVRNGFMVNPPAKAKVAYDSGVRNFFDPALVQKLPAELKPGDSLVSTISMPKGLKLRAPLWQNVERGVEDSSPVRTAAVLTCVAQPQPADAFRPGFCDRQQKIYLARNLKRELLPTMAAVNGMPALERFVRFTRRPWVGTGFFGFEEPVENMPQYGRDYGRVVGISALLLCTDLKPEQKEPLLVNYVQVGIDLGAIIRGGHPGFEGFGGHGSGRKLPIVFAGLLLDDPVSANINKAFPRASFGEDEQTAYGDCWTGAKVVFTGHSGIDTVTSVGRTRGNHWGPYEHIPPAQWGAGQNTSESYRRCCTSVAWVAQALTLRLMHAEKAWNHDPFFDYVDRWMFEDDASFVKTLKQSTGKDYSADWARQGQTWEPFVNAMWFKYRPTLAAPIDGWKRQHDESYYRTAVEQMR
ncbi:MAG: hypothetical protein ACLP9L_08130 [Thermoguttaceae bacterium]